MPLISTLIPCHNAAPWLADAVASIRGQTQRDFEIILYDDGSTDGTGDFIERLAAADSRIVAIREADNRGIVHALNAMLEVARGTYIARMDSDDISLPHRFERQVHFIESGHADLCGTWFQEFGDGIPRAVRWHSSPEALRAAMLFQNTVCHPTVMARREVFEHFRYREDRNLAEDYDLCVRASSRFRLANVPEVLLRYRRHGQQATRARRNEMEEVTRLIRGEALQVLGIEASTEELRIHHLIRAPHSLSSAEELKRIETWLLKLLDCFDHPDAKRAIATQWIRAAVRAAPLGRTMWQIYRGSPIRQMLGQRTTRDFDLAVLAATRLEYGSPVFEAMRRFGLSA